MARDVLGPNADVFGASASAVNALDQGVTGNNVTVDLPKLQAIFDQVNPANGGDGKLDLLMPEGTYFLGATGALSLPPGLTRVRIRGAGVGATAIRGLRGFDLTRVADHDVFQYIEISDLTFDRGGLTSGSNTHILFGNLNGNWGQRINASNIAIRRCRTINVPTSTSVAYQNVSIGSRHLTSGEGTTDTLKDITLEDCDFQGGSYGVAVMGDCASVTPGSGAEVFYDRITLRNVKHDAVTVPSAFGGSANFQIGGYAYGDRVSVEGCYGANSSDVGIEIDGAANAYVDARTEIVDAWNGGVFFRNFRKPGTETNASVKQRNVTDATVRNVNVDPTTTGSNVHHLQIGGDNTTAGYVFGTAVLRGKSSIETALAVPSTTGLAVNARDVKIRHLILDVDVDCPALAANTATSPTVNFVDIRSLQSGHRVTGQVRFNLAGSRAGAGVVTWKMVRIGGTDGVIDVDVTADPAGLTGLSASDTFYWIVFADFSSSTVRPTINGPAFITAPSGGVHHAIFLASTTPYTIPTGAKMLVDQLSTSKLAGLSGFDVNVDTTQIGKVLVKSVADTSTRAGGVITARTAVTSGFTSGDLTSTSPVVIRNTDVIPLDFFVKGGTVSAVEQSDDNSTYDQVTAATNAKVANVQPGQYVKVTYSVAPTVFKRPVV